MQKVKGIDPWCRCIKTVCLAKIQNYSKVTFLSASLGEKIWEEIIVSCLDFVEWKKKKEEMLRLCTLNWRNILAKKLINRDFIHALFMGRTRRSEAKVQDNILNSIFWIFKRICTLYKWTQEVGHMCSTFLGGRRPLMIAFPARP